MFLQSDNSSLSKVVVSERLYTVTHTSRENSILDLGCIQVQYIYMRNEKPESLKGSL